MGDGGDRTMIDEYEISLENLKDIKARLKNLDDDIKDPEEFALLLSASADELDKLYVREERDDKYFRLQAGMSYDLTEEEFAKCSDKDFIFKDRNYFQFKAKFFINDLFGLMNKYKLSSKDWWDVYDPPILDLDIRALFLGKILRNDLRKWCEFKIRVLVETRKHVRTI